MTRSPLTLARTAIAATALAGTVLIGTAAAQVTNTANVRFDNGNEGWSINGQNQTSPTSGNPGASLPWSDPVDTFGLEIRTSTNAAFVGDYTFKGPVRIAVDVQVDYIQFFGSPAPRELVVILIDDDGFDGAAPASVWTSLGTLDGNGAAYTTFMTTIPEVLSTELPTGWKGAGAEDPVTFEPILPAGRTWANVLQGVDRVMFTTYVPGFFFGFTNFDISVDNIRMLPIAPATWTNLGSALVGTKGEPFLSALGDLTPSSFNGLSLSNVPASAFCGLAWSGSSSPVPFAGGTLVPFPFNEPIYVTTTSAGKAFVPFLMPSGVAPGSPIYAQFAVFDPGAPQGIALSNAALGLTP